MQDYPPSVVYVEGNTTTDANYSVPTAEDPHAPKSLTQPDLPVCMQYTLLVWLPCGFLFIVAPFYFYILKNSREHKAITRNCLNISKLVSEDFLRE